jgi:hypothetical protein
MRPLLATQAPAATILIRIVVGGIFLTEGIQKFLYPDDLGAGRFAKIGIAASDIMGPFVGGVILGSNPSGVAPCNPQFRGTRRARGESFSAVAESPARNTGLKACAPHRPLDLRSCSSAANDE